MKKKEKSGSSIGLQHFDFAPNVRDPADHLYERDT